MNAEDFGEYAFYAVFAFAGVMVVILLSAWAISAITGEKDEGSQQFSRLTRCWQKCPTDGDLNFKGMECPQMCFNNLDTSLIGKEASKYLEEHSSQIEVEEGEAWYE